MSSRWSLAWVLGPLLLLFGGLACTDGRGGAPPPEKAEEHAELALHMARLQRWTHKTALALKAKNPDLSEFYLHEMEESIETIQKEVPTYEGHEVGALTEKMLVPTVEKLDRTLEARKWAAIEGRLQDLAASCNQCHQATEHGFVKVDLQNLSNRFAQDFTTEQTEKRQD